MPLQVKVRFEDPVSGRGPEFEEPLVDAKHLEVFREEVTRLLGELALLETLDEEERRERVEEGHLPEVHRRLIRLVSRAGLRLDTEEEGSEPAEPVMA